jgi:heterotetrameric sarcosine oxidase gamma subunit
VSAPDAPASPQAGERHHLPDESPVELARLGAWDRDVVEIAPLPGRAAELRSLIEARGLKLPPVGRVAGTDEWMVLCVRPGRWLWVGPRQEAGASAAEWEKACAGVATVVDLSSALKVYALTGSAVGEVLARGCRLDLNPGVFAAGRAARTLMAQVSVILARGDSGMMLLTPATTAQHFIEWLTATARPFGLRAGTDLDSKDSFIPSAGASQT